MLTAQHLPHTMLEETEINKEIQVCGLQKTWLQQRIVQLPTESRPTSGQETD